MTKVWNHVACPGCGCVCDDIRLAFDRDRLVDFQPPCPLGQQWFQLHGEPSDSVAELSGHDAQLEEAQNS